MTLQAMIRTGALAAGTTCCLGAEGLALLSALSEACASCCAFTSDTPTTPRFRPSFAASVNTLRSSASSTFRARLRTDKRSGEMKKRGFASFFFFSVWACCRFAKSLAGHPATPPTPPPPPSSSPSLSSSSAPCRGFFLCRSRPAAFRAASPTPITRPSSFRYKLRRSLLALRRSRPSLPKASSADSRSTASRHSTRRPNTVNPPSCFFLLAAATAIEALCASANVTKAVPLGRPEVLSTTASARTTSPKGSKRWRRSTSVASNGRLLTNTERPSDTSRDDEARFCFCACSPSSFSCSFDAPAVSSSSSLSSSSSSSSSSSPSSCSSSSSPSSSSPSVRAIKAEAMVVRLQNEVASLKGKLEVSEAEVARLTRLKKEVAAALKQEAEAAVANLEVMV
mmetsp:Transcript_79638/g.155848  ORF Transcript_79638/g.155848 Transcript_79638/m.155848 type:complete len:397 (+) Transcript_79638:301-1491(+)